MVHHSSAALHEVVLYNMDIDYHISLFLRLIYAGFGRATSFALAKYGSPKLAIADVNSTLLKQTAKELKEAYPNIEALPIEYDAANEDSTIKAVETAHSKFDRIHHAVNNTGITGPLAPSTPVSTKDFENILDINLTSLWIAQRKQVKIMLQQEPVQLECVPTHIRETN